MNIQDLRTQIEVAISRNDVQLLARLFQQSISLGTPGQALRKLVESKARTIARNLGYGRVKNFRELVEVHDWHTLREMYSHNFAALLRFLKTNKPYWSNVFVRYFDAKDAQHEATFKIADSGRLAYVLAKKSTLQAPLLPILAYLVKNDYEEEEDALAEGFNGEDTKTYITLCKAEDNGQALKLLLLAGTLSEEENGVSFTAHYLYIAAKILDLKLLMNIFVQLLLEVKRGAWVSVLEKTAQATLQDLLYAFGEFLDRDEDNFFFDAFIEHLDKQGTFEEKYALTDSLLGFSVMNEEVISALSEEMRYLLLHADLVVPLDQPLEVLQNFRASAALNPYEEEALAELVESFNNGSFAAAFGLVFDHQRYLELFGADETYRKLQAVLSV